MPNNHGGKREGAGRKANIAPDSPRVHITVTVSAEVYALLTAYAGGVKGNLSEAVEHFLRLGLGLPG